MKVSEKWILTTHWLADSRYVHGIWLSWKVQKQACLCLSCGHYCHDWIKGAMLQFAHLEKLSQNFSNPCWSSPSLTILVSSWFIIIPLMFFYLRKLLFSGFLQFKGKFVHGQNNSKCCDWAPSIDYSSQTFTISRSWYITVFIYLFHSCQTFILFCHVCTH